MDKRMDENLELFERLLSEKLESVRPSVHFKERMYDLVFEKRRRVVVWWKVLIAGLLPVVILGALYVFSADVIREEVRPEIVEDEESVLDYIFDFDSNLFEGLDFSNLRDLNVVEGEDVIEDSEDLGSDEPSMRVIENFIFRDSIIIDNVGSDQSEGSSGGGIIFEDTLRCENQCEASGLVCSSGGYKACGDFDGDGCREWSPVKSCGAGRACMAGQGCVDVGLPDGVDLNDYEWEFN